METQKFDHRALLSSLDPGMRESLTRRSDGAGLRHLALHAAMIVGLGAALALKVPGWPLLLLPQGVLLAFLFTLQHECTHQTPFRTRWLNEAVGHCAGALIFQPFQWFRVFHLAHHRYTNDPDRDPELVGTDKPESWRAMVVHLSTVNYWAGKFAVLARNASGRLEDYVPPSARRRVVREARILIALYLAASFAGLAWPALFRAWLLPLALGFPVLRLYLLAEHGRCAQVADMFRNSRTVFTNRFVRFVCWNMPYHAEHHAFPAVPFFRLPAFHAVARQHLGVTSDGYRRFARDYAKALGP